MLITIVSRATTAAKARLSVDSALLACPQAEVHVLDVDSTYPRAGHEQMHTPRSLDVAMAALHRASVALDAHDVDELLSSVLLRHLGAGASERTVLLHLTPGVLLLGDPFAELEPGAGPWFVRRTSHLDATRSPSPRGLALGAGYSGHLFAVRAAQVLELLAVRDLLVADEEVPRDRWIDVVVAARPYAPVTTVLGPGSLGPAAVVTSGADSARLLVDGEPVLAVDLVGVDPDDPVLLDANAEGDPRTRLSEHPALAELVLDAVGRLGARAPAGTTPAVRTSLGAPADPALRALFRMTCPTLATGVDDDDVPDPVDPDARDDLLTWLALPGPGGGVGRYLRALHTGRADLQRAFPAVPGADEAAFVGWVRQYATSEGFDAVAVQASLDALPSPRASRPAPGVNVVGYLGGELGIGESARLVLTALAAADVPAAAVPVEKHLASRRRAPLPSSSAPVSRDTVLDTTVLCVNADLTPSIAASVPRLTARSYRIGMWYWEVEDFPVEQHRGFESVDEVWVATEFVRAAIAPHSPVPVHVLTPPLPQRRDVPHLDRNRLGIPDGFTFLFSFDHLSTTVRKNPHGLLDAYCSAFAPSDGSVLVLKSINAHLRPAEGERLRRRVATRPDVVLIEDYLDADVRDGLVGLADSYVSLHRSEGLGLTMAEAMAWGKPVVATGYSGNLQFMTEANSYLVPWTYTEIPEGAAPYPAGGRWADPDLDVAATVLRAVREDEAEAQARGRQAAHDIATLHSAPRAGAVMAARWRELERDRRVRSRPTVRSVTAGLRRSR